MGFYSYPGNGICQNLSMGFVLFCFVFFFFCFYMHVGNLGNHLFKWQMWINQVCAKCCLLSNQTIGCALLVRFILFVFGNTRGIQERDEKIARWGILIKKEQKYDIRTPPPALFGYCLDMRIFVSRKKFCFLSEIYDSLQELFEVTETLFLTYLN